jgi:hypothetical protein
MEATLGYFETLGKAEIEKEQGMRNEKANV